MDSQRDRVVKSVTGLMIKLVTAFVVMILDSEPVSYGEDSISTHKPQLILI